MGFDILARGLACIQYVAYHSPEYSQRTPILPSQSYSFALLRAAMTRGAEIVIMRSKSMWFSAVPELASYHRLHIGANPRAPYLSRGNLQGSYAVIA